MICFSNTSVCSFSLKSVDLCYIGQLNYWLMTLNLYRLVFVLFQDEYILGESLIPETQSAFLDVFLLEFMQKGFKLCVPVVNPAGIPILSAFLIISFHRLLGVSPVPACSEVSQGLKGRLSSDLGLTLFQEFVLQFPATLEAQSSALRHLSQKGCVAVGRRASSGTLYKYGLRSV